MGTIAVILCQWQGEWCLAIRGRPESSGCSIRIPNCSKFADESCGFIRQRHGAFWHKHFPSTDGITFYPELYYRGCQVAPQHWHFESEVPILNCFLQPEDIGPALFGGVPVPDYVTQFPEFLRLAQQDGWNWDMKDGGTKYMHVDDLEKIEGPPPEGPF